MSMKKFLVIIMAAVLVLFASGCDTNKGAPLEVWEELNGSFVRDNSGGRHANVAALAMKYLSNGCVMFEFRLLDSDSAADDFSHDVLIPGVLIVDENGAGTYETTPDALIPFAIDFKLSKDGQQVTVTHTGDLVVSPDGEYMLWNIGVDVSSSSANAIIGHLPTAATSLNSNIGAYTVNYPESLVAGWFYVVEATFDDTGAVLAKFLIAKDLSAVWRADDDIEPALIFGSAQPMMDGEVFLWADDDIYSDSEEGEITYDIYFSPSPVVSAVIDSGISMAANTSGKLSAILPWELPYTITAKSSAGNVAEVDINGIVRALAEGEATIEGVILVEDGEKAFSIDIFVTNELEQEEVVN